MVIVSKTMSYGTQEQSYTHFVQCGHFLAKKQFRYFHGASLVLRPTVSEHQLKDLRRPR